MTAFLHRPEEFKQTEGTIPQTTGFSECPLFFVADIEGNKLNGLVECLLAPKWSQQ